MNNDGSNANPVREDLFKRLGINHGFSTSFFEQRGFIRHARTFKSLSDQYQRMLNDSMKQVHAFLNAAYEFCNAPTNEGLNQLQAAALQGLKSRHDRVTLNEEKAFLKTVMHYGFEGVCYFLTEFQKDNFQRNALDVNQMQDLYSSLSNIIAELAKTETTNTKAAPPPQKP